MDTRRLIMGSYKGPLSVAATLRVAIRINKRTFRGAMRLRAA